MSSELNSEARQEYLNLRVDSLLGIPKEYQRLYEKRPGGFFLKIQESVVSKDRLDEFRENNIALRKKVEQLQKNQGSKSSALSSVGSSNASSIKEGQLGESGTEGKQAEGKQAEGKQAEENQAKGKQEESSSLESSSLEKRREPAGKKEESKEEEIRGEEGEKEGEKEGELEELRKEVASLRLEKREQGIREKLFLQAERSGLLKEAYRDLWARFRETEWYMELIRKEGFEEEKGMEWILSLREGAGHLFSKSSGGGLSSLGIKTEGNGSVIYGDPRELLS